MTSRLVALLAGVLALAGFTSQTPRELRVLTFNIHHAEGMDGRLDVERIAQVIRDSKADIVGLQEVDRGVERTGRRDLLKEIADLTGMRFSFGKNLDHQGGEYGNAFLTSHPIVSEGNKPLPNANNVEPRGVLQTVIDVAGTKVLVLTTHLDFSRDERDRVASADAMLAMVEAFGGGPVIAMGDFNDSPERTPWKRLTSGFTDVWTAVGQSDGFTIPVETPRRRIDWILVRGLTPVRAEVLRTDASDHLPVVATVTLP
ncbi:MAG: endonuclease/exonuclease/phosphatase family protein [Acidobacteria bacterium]|nr:endonuclease/exonuclease/phosphatase family protein [Acidobacteriota bacterium]